jgi:hypothetical protein
MTREGTNQPRQDAEAGISHRRKGREMSTEISTNTAPARGLALASFDDAFRFSKIVASSEFAPKDFRGKPESCMLAIQHGSEVGLSPMQSLQSIAVINGRPTIWGDAALALVQASPVCEFVYETVEGDGEGMAAVCQAKRRGYSKPTTVTFTVADAKKAGLWGKQGPWQQYPRRMLQLRARGFALRDAFPDVLRGLVTAEEAQDYTAGEPIVTQPEAVHAKPAEQAKPEDMTKARRAIAAAKAVDRLRQIHATVSERLDAGFYSPTQASELVELIDTRMELMTPRGDAYEGPDVEHFDAAEIEAEARA